MEKVIKCVAKGAPKPNAAWYRNGKELNTTDCHVTPNDKSCDDVIYEVYEDNPSSSLHSTYNTQVLKIRSALYPRDQGKFECIATNGQLPNYNLVIDLDVQGMYMYLLMYCIYKLFSYNAKAINLILWFICNLGPIFHFCSQVHNV